MPLLRHSLIGSRVWRSAWIAIAIFSLICSLATRYYAPATSQVHTAKSVERRSLEPKRQHLDRDATRWVAPVASFASLEPETVGARVPHAELLPSMVVLDESLYNRPPPSSEFFL